MEKLLLLGFSIHPDKNRDTRTEGAIFVALFVFGFMIGALNLQVCVCGSIVFCTFAK